MAFKRTHLKDLIERVLKHDLPMLYSTEAVELLLGTCAQESLFGTYLKQLGLPIGVGGLGIFQIEKLTFDDLVNRYSGNFPVIKDFRYEQLEWDLRASIIMARLKYFSCPGRIPKDLKGQAEYYKKYYNTPLGAASPQQYVENFEKYITHG